MCYRIKEQRFEQRDVIVENQFGQLTLTVKRPDTLCVPAEKDGVSSALNINHFKCYRVKVARGTPKFTPVQIDLTDQWETKTLIVERPKFLCNPVDKDGEGVVNPEGHLTCYRIKDAPGQAKFERQTPDILDQFVDQGLPALRGDCRQSTFMCVPSTKRLASPSGPVIAE
jgi:hypothetical protein